MSQKLVTNIIILATLIDSIEMTKNESSLLKAIILMNHQDNELTPRTAEAIGKFRDRLHGALYQNCKPDESATIRFARILHILPKLFVCFFVYAGV